MRAQRWMGNAACAGMDPDIFFPESGGFSDPAKAVCATCPMTSECLAYAVDLGIFHGVFGGKSARQRTAVRRYGSRVAV